MARASQGQTTRTRRVSAPGAADAEAPTAAPARRRGRPPKSQGVGGPNSSLSSALGALTAHIQSLEEENTQLRQKMATAEADSREVREWLESINVKVKAAPSVAAKPTQAARPRRAADTEAAPKAVAAKPAAAASGAAAKRQPVSEETRRTVEQVIREMGRATAGQIAAEVTRLGHPMSGRAVRHIAQGVGATATVDTDGTRVYHLA